MKAWASGRANKLPATADRMMGWPDPVGPTDKVWRCWASAAKERSTSRACRGRSIMAASPLLCPARATRHGGTARGLGIRVRPVCGCWRFRRSLRATHEGGVVHVVGRDRGLDHALVLAVLVFVSVDLAEKLDAIEIGKPADAARVLRGRTVVARMNAAR